MYSINKYIMHALSMNKINKCSLYKLKSYESTVYKKIK